MSSQTCGLDNDPGDLVGVTVAAGSPVLQVAVTLGRHLPGNSDAAASIGHACAEVLDARGLVEASQPPLVILSRNVNIVNMKEFSSKLTFPP